MSTNCTTRSAVPAERMPRTRRKKASLFLNWMWIGIVQIMSSRAEDGACCRAMKMPSGKSAMSLTGLRAAFSAPVGCDRAGSTARSAAIVSASRDASAAENPASSAASQRRSNCPAMRARTSGAALAVR